MCRFTISLMRPKEANKLRDTFVLNRSSTNPLEKANVISQVRFTAGSR